MRFLVTTLSLIALLSGCKESGSSSSIADASSQSPTTLDTTSSGNDTSNSETPIPATEQPASTEADDNSAAESTPDEDTTTNTTTSADDIDGQEMPTAEQPVTTAEEEEASPDPSDDSVATESSDEDAPTDWYKPGPLTTWQWQLSGTINTSYGVELYDIDLFDSPISLINELHTKGIKVICYFSGGSYEEWRDDANQFTENDMGNNLDDWPGERWLDIRTTNVHNIMTSRLDLAVTKGCDGVEPDNMDGYTNNPGVSINAQDQLTYNKFIANEAHNRGLSVALKNDLDQVEELVDFFDFAINEQCFQYKECDLLKPFTDNGKAILNAEYKNLWKNDSAERAKLCSDANAAGISTLVLPLNLNDNFRHSCL